MGWGKQIKTHTCLQIGKIRSDDEKSMILFINSPTSILLTGLFSQAVIAEMRSLMKVSLLDLFKRFLCLKIIFSLSGTKRKTAERKLLQIHSL